MKDKNLKVIHHPGENGELYVQTRHKKNKRKVL